MYNVNKIEINIDNTFNTINVLIMPDTLKAYKNNKENNIDEEYIKRLLRIISLWDHKYIDNSVIDGSSFEVKVYTTSGVDRFYGKNKYPNNYQELLDMLGDLDG